MKASKKITFLILLCITIVFGACDPDIHTLEFFADPSSPQADREFTLFWNLSEDLDEYITQQKLIAVSTSGNVYSETIFEIDDNNERSYKLENKRYRGVFLEVTGKRKKYEKTVKSYLPLISPPIASLDIEQNGYKVGGGEFPYREYPDLGRRSDQGTKIEITDVFAVYDGKYNDDKILTESDGIFNNISEFYESGEPFYATQSNYFEPEDSKGKFGYRKGNTYLFQIASNGIQTAALQSNVAISCLGMSIGGEKSKKGSYLDITGSYPFVLFLFFNYPGGNLNLSPHFIDAQFVFPNQEIVLEHNRGPEMKDWNLAYNPISSINIEFAPELPPGVVGGTQDDIRVYFKSLGVRRQLTLSDYGLCYTICSLSGHIHANIVSDIPVIH